MYLVNNFGRVVEVEDQLAKQHIARGRMREAKPDELSAYMQRQQERVVDNLAPEATVFYQTVPSGPDGYGMSRDHLKRKLFKEGVVLSENYTGQKVGLVYNYPYALAQLRTDIKLIYTMFESDKIPDEWVEYLQMADEVMVPSKFCQKAFKAAGIKTTVVPLGYNDDIFQPVPRRRRNGDVFTFLQYDSFNARKGFLEVFEAFNNEFKANEPVRLILKTAQEHVAIPVLKSQYPQIDAITGMMSEMQLLNLLAEADCFVYPSRGEGFGITPLEAMATGIPAIVPNAHGIAEYFDESVMLSVPFEPTPALYNRFKGKHMGNMVIVDVPALQKQMRWAYEHKKDVKALGEAAADYAKQYTYTKTAQRLAAIINKWQKASVTRKADGKYLEVVKL